MHAAHLVSSHISTGALRTWNVLSFGLGSLTLCSEPGRRKSSPLRRPSRTSREARVQAHALDVQLEEANHLVGLASPTPGPFGSTLGIVLRCLLLLRLRRQWSGPREYDQQQRDIPKRETKCHIVT
jgi:hypothetical protein